MLRLSFAGRRAAPIAALSQRWCSAGDTAALEVDARASGDGDHDVAPTKSPKVKAAPNVCRKPVSTPRAPRAKAFPAAPPTAQSRQRAALAVGVLERRIQDASLPPFAAKSLWPLLSSHFKLIDEFNVAGHTRRLARVGTMLRFLRDHNVLLHAALRHDAAGAAWHVTPEFGRLAVVGEALLRDEVATRLNKLLPDASLGELCAMRDACTAPAAVVALYDAINMNRLLLPAAARRKLPPTAEQKATLLYAALAELHWFVVKTKATDRTHNNALFPPSDALILHVLSAHVVESVCADSVYVVLQPLLDDCRRRWANYGLSTVGQFKAVPRLSAVHDLAATARTCDVSAAPKDGERPTATLQREVPSRGCLRSAAVPTLQWSTLERRNDTAGSDAPRAERAAVSAVPAVAVNSVPLSSEEKKALRQLTAL
jgi:hypothetical protein